MKNDFDNKEVGMACGVQESIPSIRLYDYEKVCGAASTNDKDYPEKFCLNEVEMGVCVKNQGAIGACVACATSSTIEALLLREMLGLEEGTEITEELLETMMDKLFGYDEISEGFTYGFCRQNTSRSYGMIPTDALKYLTEKGTVPKKYFNYLNEMPDIKDTVNNDYKELHELALKYRIKGYVAIPNKKPQKDYDIKDALMKYRVPLVAISPSAFGESHCICIVGWDDTKDTYIIKNSWGENWGDNGIAGKKKDTISSVYVLLGQDIKLPFEDVKEDDWFYSAVKHVYMSDIMNGRTETTFNPNEPMTRAEIATVISRLMKKIDERFENFNKILEEKNVFDDYKI